MSPLTAQTVRQALNAIIDPELGFSIVDLGLVYDIQVVPNRISIIMTLTSPVCPLQDFFRQQIGQQLKKIDDQSVNEQLVIDVQFTFTPPWSADKAAAHVQDYFVLKGIPLTR